ncbi:glycoside hydrolase family 13 protein [Jonesiaceae bacterium BS-20]|uniref:Glycoside hydrolase family 13 protein n=1 Tax=Jonesiaceae bacterium BS-20 TaxID=3120821 RepID=A0AAU7DRF8_9MICO
MPHILAAAVPHHDGSSLYVQELPRQVGQTITVRVRVPLATAEKSVHLRVVRDGEPRISPARLVSTTEYERWYEANLLVHNPVTNYRFFFELETGYAWLNASGWYTREIPDAHDFKVTVYGVAPDWAREGLVYQIFPDRFARSKAKGELTPETASNDLPHWALPATDWNQDPIPSGENVGRHFFGGDLDGITEHLDYLKDLGVTTVYLTPVFPGQSNHRYDANTFDEVDPVLGGNEAYARLSQAVHDRGMKLMGDITTNHTGIGHEWFTTAQSDPQSLEHDFFYWTDDPCGYASWKEVTSLPKLNYHSQELAQRMIDGPESAIGKWLAPPYSLDGWRVDVANMTGRYGTDDMTHDIARRARKTVTDANPQGLVIAEHFHDASRDLDGDGWHANMNYTAFTRPVWSWVADPKLGTPAFGLPSALPQNTGRDMVASMREFDAAIPFQVTASQWNMLGSHDTPRLRTLVGDTAMVEVAAGMLLTYLGVPVIFAGDEVGLTGVNGEHARKTMPWDDPSRWDDQIHRIYADLIAVRGASTAFSQGGLRWLVVADDAVVFLRESADACALVALSRAPWSGAKIPRFLGVPAGQWGGHTQAEQSIESGGPSDATIGQIPQTLYGNTTLATEGDHFVIQGFGPGVGIWRLR